MSSLKLLHSGGNGVIISAPSSNPASNRTITLNDTYAGDGSFVTANSSDKVGIGTASPSHKLHVVSSDTDTAFFKGRFVRVDGAASSDSPRVNFSLDGTDKTSLMCNRTDSSLNLETLTSAPIKLTTDSTERMRIDSSGNVGIGTTNPEYLLNVVKGGVDMCRFQQTTNNESDGYEAILIKHAAALSGQNGLGLRFQNSSGTTVGKIDFGQSTTQYRTSSDYRLKENATAISDGITRLKTLKPYQFNWIAEKGQPKVDGFFAHEVTAVPEAISGTKDQVDSDNKPLYQSIDHSKLVPLLTAALQEEIGKREALEARVAALEAA